MFCGCWCIMLNSDGVVDGMIENKFRFTQWKEKSREGPLPLWAFLCSSPLLCAFNWAKTIVQKESGPRPFRNVESHPEGGFNLNSTGIIEAIADKITRNGKEEIVAIKIALEDFYQYSNQRFVLQIRNSQGDPLKATLAARELINKRHVQAIIGPQSWEETTSVAEMKAVAAIVQSWKWHSVNIIYEERDASSTQVLSYLYSAFSEACVHVSQISSIPPFVSSSLSQELEKLREGQCRVFVVVISSLPLAIILFEIANKMNMMEKNSVWIIADPFTSLVHSLNASALSSMQGILGVKGNFPVIGHQYEDFCLKFRQKFSSENPQEFNNEPGIFAAHAYDAAWTLALAMSKTNNKRGQVLLDKILLYNFTGLSGKIQFNGQKLPPSHTFQIINVIGNGYKEIGFWSDGLGFSNHIGQNATHFSSMKELGQVLWPGRPWDTPRGWTLPTIDKPLRVGVPALSTLKQFIDITHDQSGNTIFQGFTIDLFRETVKFLPYHLPYKLYAFNDT
ncbi:hypothetical protein RJT34_29241 [Clitoria ternatea]|uniref:Receptor ligand binding region domain-containing protein n=1 Tax=Clitoria ternatea TaxID=43366 RepID=A0AAN9FAB6_CLITE